MIFRRRRPSSRSGSRPRRTAAPTGSRRAGAASRHVRGAARTRLWTMRDGTRFECAECGHQTSLTSGTVLEKTRKPLQDVVPRDLRDLDAAHRHLGQGPAAHHGLRLLRDGVDVAAQAPRRDGALRQRAARPFRPDRRGARRGKGRPTQAARPGGGRGKRARAPRPRRQQ